MTEGCSADQIVAKRISASRGLIGQILLPEGFEELEQQEPGLLSCGWQKRFLYSKNRSLEISLFYRGAGIGLENAAGFRSLLEAGPRLFIEQGAANLVSADSKPQGMFELKELLKSLTCCLGNLKNNQLLNPASGVYGPAFFLERLEVLELVGKNVLLAKGYFHGPDGDARTYYCGIFIDASPQDAKRCRIEEVIFQAAEEHVFERHFPAFVSALASIVWNKESIESPQKEQLKNFELNRLFD